MELTYKKKDTYQIICDEKGYAGVCNIIENLDIFSDKIYLVSTSTSQEIPLEKMKKIVSEIKE